MKLPLEYRVDVELSNGTFDCFETQWLPEVEGGDLIIWEEKDVSAQVIMSGGWTMFWIASEMVEADPDDDWIDWENL